MSPERAAALVARWVRLYTAGLPASVARRRIEEIDADLHDHIAHERSLGSADDRIARAIVARMARGAVDDLTWREHEARAARMQPTKEQTVETLSLRRSAVRVSALSLAVLAIPLIGTALSDEVSWSLADFVFAGVILGIIGVAFELAVRRAGNMVVAAAVAGLGIAAGVVGEIDDAPGLVVLGLLLIAGAGAIAYRRLKPAL